MAALLSTLGHLMTLVVWASLTLGPVVGGLKLYKATKENNRQEMVRKTATYNPGPKTYRL